MATHYNVTIEALYPYSTEIIWPALTKRIKRNIARRDYAEKAAWALCYELLDGLSLRDRPVAYKMRDWAHSVVHNIRPNWRETFLLREYIVTVERWDTPSR